MSNDTAQSSPATEDVSVFVKYPEPAGFKELVAGTPMVWDPTFMDTLQTRPSIFFTFGVENAARLTMLTGIQFMAVEKRNLQLSIPISGSLGEYKALAVERPELADVVSIAAGKRATFVGPDNMMGLEIWQKATILKLATRLNMSVSQETEFVKSAVEVFETFKELTSLLPPGLLEVLAKARRADTEDMPANTSMHQPCATGRVH